MKRFLYVLCAVLLWVAVGEARPRKDVSKQETEVEKRLSGGDYDIKVRCAYPMAGPCIMLNYPYSLRVAKDSAYVHLPYYGRGYSLPYGGGEGLDFQGTVENYVRTQKKKQSEVSFTVRTQEDSYVFRLSVFSSGETSISVTMNRKQPISFSGNMEL